MNILLLRPPRRGAFDLGLSVAPMGLAYIAGSLQRAGFSVQIMDAYALGWNWGRLRKWIEKRKFDVLGLTAMTPTIDLFVSLTIILFYIKLPVSI